MLELLEQQKRLTRNQKKIVAAAVIGDMLDYFDFGLIGFALAFIVGPWKLTYGQSAMILLTSGIGGVPGALFYGWLADRIGRRTVFILTALNFSLATGVMALTPDQGGWIFLSVCRFFVGFGVAGLFTVDLPLVQEFVPTSKRGFVGGLVTSLLPVAGIMGAALGAFVTPVLGWRGLFAVGLLPATVTLLIRAWVPESPRWLIRMGRLDEARRSLAWALQIDQKGSCRNYRCQSRSPYRSPAIATARPLPHKGRQRHSRHRQKSADRTASGRKPRRRRQTNYGNSRPKPGKLPPQSSAIHRMVAVRSRPTDSRRQSARPRRPDRRRSSDRRPGRV